MDIPWMPGEHASSDQLKTIVVRLMGREKLRRESAKGCYKMTKSLWKSGKAPQNAAGLSHFSTDTADNFF